MGNVEEGYGGREGYTDRQILYGWAYQHMLAMGLEEGDVVVDVGAGYCDLDMYLRQRGWFGRYLPVDPSVTPGVDLEDWVPHGPAQFFVCLDTTEHLHNWAELLLAMRRSATKGVVVSTPDADTVDVLAMHPSHVSAQTRSDFQALGFEVTNYALGSYEQMVGWAHGTGQGHR